MKKILKTVILFSIVFLTIYGIFNKIKGDILLVESVPSVFNSVDFSIDFESGGTRIKKDGEQVFPIRHDKNFLYILNGAGNDFKSFKIDKSEKEIVITQSLFDFKHRDKIYYQVIKIPRKDYEDIIFNNKIKVTIRVQYAVSQFKLVEYDLVNKSFNIIKSTIRGK